MAEPDELRQYDSFLAVFEPPPEMDLLPGLDEWIGRELFCSVLWRITEEDCPDCAGNWAVGIGDRYSGLGAGPGVEGRFPRTWIESQALRIVRITDRMEESA